MELEKIFLQATDGIQLVGLLHKPLKPTKEVIIAVHGMSSNLFSYRDDVIAKKVVENNIAFFNFNNRGTGLMSYITKKQMGKSVTHIGGTSYEEVLDSPCDIIGAVLKMKELGYEKIHLQGHSLGATKVLYTYHQLQEKQDRQILDSISSLILLSLIDIPYVIKFRIGRKKVSGSNTICTNFSG